MVAKTAQLVMQVPSDVIHVTVPQQIMRSNQSQPSQYLSHCIKVTIFFTADGAPLRALHARESSAIKIQS